MSESRDFYVKKIKAKLDEWNAEIDRLEAISRQKGADMQASYQNRFKELKEKRQSTRIDREGGKRGRRAGRGRPKSRMTAGRTADGTRLVPLMMPRRSPSCDAWAQKEPAAAMRRSFRRPLSTVRGGCSTPAP